MAKYRMVRIEFWKNPIVMEEMSPEDKYFYLYLLTNPQTTQIGIYRITKKQMAFDLGYSIESVHSLMERFEVYYRLIRYNPETRELAIRDWGKENLQKAGKPVMDCILSELKEVMDCTLIPYVSESIHKKEIRSLYESFGRQDEIDPSITDDEDSDDTWAKRKKQQKTFVLTIENNPETVDVKEIMEFWDANGFGFSNINAKQQLLSWLDNSSLLQPKDMILKAMTIACANNKRRLNYIEGILRNWENESLLTVEEVDSYEMKQIPVFTNRQSNESIPAGRAIPSGFEFDLTAGEKE
jgi:DnaD/phage-associated family protein